MKRMMRSGFRNKEGGISIIFASLSLVMGMSMVGLAVDAGTIFVIKASASAAADAAALAAGRAVSLGSDYASANAAATASANRFFHANFPNGFMNVDTSQLTLTPTFAMGQDNGQPTGVLTVNVVGQLQVPTYFMRILNQPTMNIATQGVTTRRSLVMVVILDRSGSMGSRQTSAGVQPTVPGTTGCEAMVYGALQFVDMFSPYDMVGLVSYASTPRLDLAVQSDFKNTIKTKIAGITCGGSTNTTGALWMAHQQILAKNLKLAVNTVVLFSDGAPNGINAKWPIKRSVDNRYGKVPSSSGVATSPAPPNTPSGNQSNCVNYFDRLCYSVPVRCSASTPEPTAQLTSGDEALGSRSALEQSMSGDASSMRNVPSGCPTSSSNVTTSTIAYIPEFDRWGNRTWGHSPPFKDNWVFDVNNRCAPSGANLTPGSPTCRTVGGTFAQYPTAGAGTNFFPAGHPYAGKLRVDTPNALRVAGMNSAMSMAETIRATPELKIKMYTVFLMNGSDSIDRDFMAVMANEEEIPPLPWDSTAPVKPNPYFNAAQEKGMYIPLSNRNDLVAAFMDIASSLLRISQ
jgi:Flp pilus assembly protein TadG